MLRILPLGGLGEVGKNCMVVDDGEHALILDCGVTFREPEFGVDVVHPDFSVLNDMADRLRGVVLTHGHEDHIGALPYLLARHRLPVYGPAYALGVVQERLDEHDVEGDLHAISPRRPFRVGHFEVEPVRVAHSVADAVALAVRTSQGMLFHTGDFKFDDHAPEHERVDEERIAELGIEGIDLMLSDSTNAEVEGASGSELDVAEALESWVASAKGAVVVSMFASNVPRLAALGKIAARTQRRLVLLGRSMHMHVEIAHETGHLHWPDSLRWSEQRVRELPRNAILAVATGSQGEPRAALARLARGEHPELLLGEGDRVILSSRVIPGHEREVAELRDALLRRGVEVVSGQRDRSVHVSGHATAGEQRRMLELAMPRAFVPVHGTLSHLHAHAEHAARAGVGQHVVVENGVSAELVDGVLRRGDAFKVGAVSTFRGAPLAESTLRERRIMAQRGLLVVVCSTSSRGVVDDITVMAHGLGSPAQRGSLERRAAAEVRKVLSRRPLDAALSAKQAARRVFADALGTKPDVLLRWLGMDLG